MPPGEGAFGVCSLWREECLARQGGVAQARQDVEPLLGYANDLGPFSEEIDPATGAALENFPEAFTHMGLINAALTLAEAQGERSTVAPEERAANAEMEERR